MFFLEMPKEEGFKPSESSTPTMEVGKSFECGVKPSKSNCLDNTPDFALDFFSFNPVDLEAKCILCFKP